MWSQATCWTRKKTVRVIGRSKERLQPLVDRGAEAFVADLSDQAALTKAFTGAEGVYAMIPPSIDQPGFSQRAAPGEPSNCSERWSRRE